MEDSRKLQFDSYFDLVDRKLEGFTLDRPTKIIIDTDPGADDAQAIILAIYLAKKMNVEILGITAMAGNGTLEDVVLNAQLTLLAADAPEIPIYRGQRDYLHPYEYEHPHYGMDGFGEYSQEMKDIASNLVNVQDQPAVEFLSQTAAKYPAPLTNIAVVLKQDPSFGKNIKNIVLLGGSYLAHGNTKYNCSEFNFLKDPEAASIVFELCDHITMVPIEVSRSFRRLPQTYVSQAFTAETKKGQLVNKSFQIAYRNSGNYYEVVDPCAIAVAFCPEVVTEHYKKPCFIETEGRYTRGMVVIDWIGRSSEKRHNTNIIASIDLLFLYLFLNG